MTSKLEYALSLAEKGFYVFRIKRNGKRPFAEGWQSEATCNAAEVEALFAGHDYNIGIFTGKYFQFSGSTLCDRALAIVDVDTKDGKLGNSTMEHMEIMGFDFPPTLTVTTASGGRHLFYTVDTPIQGGTNKVGQHVDLKSHGGYVVAPGSSVDNALYLITDNQPIHDAPEWLIKKAGRPMDKSALTDIPAADMDSDQAITRATEYLLSAPEAISGSGGNQTTLTAAMVCRDFGLSLSMTEDLLWKHYNPRCQPPWAHDELLPIVANAYRYAKLAAGNSSPHSEFTPIALDPKEEEAERKTGLYYEWCEHITTDENHHPLIEDLLDQGTMSVLYGDSNAGKTFVAMDLAFHIAMGQNWDNKRVTQGSVLYIAAEGGRGARNRIAAMRQKYNSHDAPFALVPCPVNLFDQPKDVKTLVKLIKQAEAEKGHLRLVVIDTLARAMSGGNENAAEDMSLFVENLDAIRHHTKAHILVVHHSGKDASKGARGSSVLRAATDTELEVAEKTIITKKQRDMEFARPIGFELTPVELGTNAYGKTITSCTLTLVDAEARQDYSASNRMTPRDLVCLLALQNCKAARSIRNYDHVVDLEVWSKCCEDFDMSMVPGVKSWPKTRNAFNVAFKASRERLIGFGRVEELEDKQWAFLKQ